MKKNVLILALAVALAACAGPQVTRVQKLSETADAPYRNVLVVSLFKSFDVRRYLEKDIVKQLAARGVAAVASTSLMDTRTPVTRQTFLAMVEAQGSDAVLVTRLVNLETGARLRDANPESTYIIRPTYYYNVWSVELKEYIEPQTLELHHSFVLATQLYSVLKKEPVWAIESTTNVTVGYNERGDTSIITDEAKSIVRYLSRDGLLSP